MTPEELKAVRNWVREEKFSCLNTYGRAVVTKLANEVERLQGIIAALESPSEQPGVLEDW